MSLPTCPVEALRIVVTSTFRPFTQIDWAVYSGCGSKTPLIAEREDLGFVIMVDDNVIVFINGMDEQVLYLLNEL